MKTTRGKKQKKSNAGRKWFDGKDENAIIGKLEETAAIDATVEESIFYADITRDSYYNYLKEHPEFANRLESLRQKPFLLARQTVVKNLTNPEGAKWYLERKKKLEFAQRTELTGNEGEAIKLDGGLTDAIEHIYGKQNKPS